MKTSPDDLKSFLESWGSIVKELRLAHGISQRELSRRTEVARNTIRKIEEAETVPDLWAMAKIFDVFGHDLDVLQRDIEETHQEAKSA